jgi:hypothetical protein
MSVLGAPDDRLGVFATVAILVGGIVGTGIFTVPAAIADYGLKRRVGPQRSRTPSPAPCRRPRRCCEPQPRVTARTSACGRRHPRQHVPGPVARMQTRVERRARLADHVDRHDLARRADVHAVVVAEVLPELWALACPAGHT